MTGQCRSTQDLINESQGLVRSLASAIHRKLPPNVELEDLVAYGQVGLAEAAKGFDPARGCQFSTYAYYCIRGAIYDGLSKMAWFGRGQYKHVRTEQMTNDVLRVENEERDQPSEGGVEGDMRWFCNLSRTLAVVHLATHADEQNEGGVSIPADASAEEPFVVAVGRETRQRLHELIGALPEAARNLIRATYFEGLTLQEAGERIGVSKSWASRLHALTLQRLARSLKPLGIAPSTPGNSTLRTVPAGTTRQGASDS